MKGPACSGQDWCMASEMKLAYWKGKKFWVGILLGRPEIMSQGRTLKELEDNLKEACLLMAMDDVSENHN
jgi:predicted RNase H-like HicB family nuclease